MSFLEKLTESEKEELRKFILETINKVVSASTPLVTQRQMTKSIVKRINKIVKITTQP